jgi:hypothetical protein
VQQSLLFEMALLLRSVPMILRMRLVQLNDVPMPVIMIVRMSVIMAVIVVV